MDSSVGTRKLLRLRGQVLCQGLEIAESSCRLTLSSGMETLEIGQPSNSCRRHQKKTKSMPMTAIGEALESSSDEWGKVLVVRTSACLTREQKAELANMKMGGVNSSPGTDSMICSAKNGLLHAPRTQPLESGRDEGPRVRDECRFRT